MPLSEQIQAAIKKRLENFFSASGGLRVQAIGGGSINQTYRLEFAGQLLFCKLNSASKFPHLFETERRGLRLIQTRSTLLTPSVIDCFESGDAQVLLLEWIEPGERTEGFWKIFGERLAALHQVSAPHFGLEEENYMGSVPQANHPSVSWPRFFRDQRLQPLVAKCSEKNLLPSKLCRQFERLYQRLPEVFGQEQKPALVHGDLWSGNYMCNQASEPVLIDPAVYFGHPAVDLGMTTLFGGFRSAFYESYHYHAPLPSNYEEQWQVANLYPLLIHLYLFGRSYLPQMEQTLHKF